MKKIFKCALPLLLAAIMLMSSASMSFFAVEAQAAEYAVGDIVEFGFYPQTQVTDEVLLSELNSQTLNWISYGYYSGEGEEGSMVQSDYMKYADVEYNGAKYRAVYFTEYRPFLVYYTSYESYSYQNNNGYNTNTTYWFKYEPIKWRVLDPSDGFIMCETIIDSQAYSNTIYESNDEYWNDSNNQNYINDYATSSIRGWLNDDFYNTAFTSDQQTSIKTTTLDNSAYSDEYSQYDSAATNDKIFLLSYNEMLNANYGFDVDDSAYDEARKAQRSDYAKCHGLDADSKETSHWYLRSPGSYGSCSCGVNNDGYVRDNSSVSRTDVGIRPALKISNLSTISENSSDANGNDNAPSANTENTLPTPAIIGIATAAVVVVAGIVAGIVLGKKKKVK